MANVANKCVTCGDTFIPPAGPGRPRTRCPVCFRPDRHKRVTITPVVCTRECLTCSAEFTTLSNSPKRYCSPTCRDLQHREPCVVCGLPTTRRKGDSRLRVAAMHPACKPPKHGTLHTYKKKGCRCDLCILANTDSHKRFGAQWITPADRLHVYTRDRWICQLCGAPVDRNLIGAKTHGTPSIDHIIPRSRGGTHALDNLQLAHLGCNARKGAKDI